MHEYGHVEHGIWPATCTHPVAHLAQGRQVASQGVPAVVYQIVVYRSVVYRTAQTRPL